MTYDKWVESLYLPTKQVTVPVDASLVCLMPPKSAGFSWLSKSFDIAMGNGRGKYRSGESLDRC